MTASRVCPHCGRMVLGAIEGEHHHMLRVHKDIIDQRFADAGAGHGAAVFINTTFDGRDASWPMTGT